MPQGTLDNRVLDVRPDRIDFRDLVYRPRLVSLPEQYPAPSDIEKYLSLYCAHGMILDQGSEGACTGFGLAAVVNYLLWRKGFPEPEPIEHVSARMLYELARMYDEWQGEDYEGSSCRGAMKGWRRHGVCTHGHWPYSPAKFVPPKPGWQADAARRPLGAYYRIDKSSLNDLHSAIHEVGAIYCSATVHSGWQLGSHSQLPQVKEAAVASGGHAFAIVGYTSTGFIVQNSWGPDWGYGGFAILTYSDWLRNGVDAWVAVMGAPIETAKVGSAMAVQALQSTAGTAIAGWTPFWGAAKYEYKNPTAKPLERDKALQYTIMTGNNGRPIRHLLDAEDAAHAVEIVAFRNADLWLTENSANKIAIYAHGGLNSEEASIRRICVMAPYFLGNGIYPIFLTWKTSFLETFADLAEDMVFGGAPAALPSMEDIRERWDRAIEVGCQPAVKPIWSQMKQNAQYGATAGGGLLLLAQQLARLAKKQSDLEIHLVGHSAGSFLAGYLVNLLGAKKLPTATCTLFAPACSVDFALRQYRTAIEKKFLEQGGLHFEVLSDERERADSVGPYGKSLLYLVSRALEDYHKTPLLGMEAAWMGPENNGWPATGAAAIDKWLDFWSEMKNFAISGAERAEVSDGQGTIKLAHGSFDNDVEVVTGTLQRIAGTKKLTVAVENLRY